MKWRKKSCTNTTSFHLYKICTAYELMLDNNVLIVGNVKVYLIFLNTTIWLIYS